MKIHTLGMKVAVSIPDSLFAEADALAKLRQISRSKLYARALTSYVANSAKDRVTELANLAADELGTEIDPVVRAGARTVLKYTDW